MTVEIGRLRADSIIGLEEAVSPTRAETLLRRQFSYWEGIAEKRQNSWIWRKILPGYDLLCTLYQNKGLIYERGQTLVLDPEILQRMLLGLMKEKGMDEIYREPIPTLPDYDGAFRFQANGLISFTRIDCDHAKNNMGTQWFIEDAMSPVPIEGKTPRKIRQMGTLG